MISNEDVSDGIALFKQQICGQKIVIPPVNTWPATIASLFSTAPVESVKENMAAICQVADGFHLLTAGITS